MDEYQTLRSELIEAWHRLLNRTCTSKDLALISKSLKEDEPLLEFDEVYEQVKNDAIVNKTPLAEDQKEAYRKEAFQLIAEYERKRGRSLSPTIDHFRKIRYVAAAVLLVILIPASYLFLRSKTEQFTTQTIEKVTKEGEIMTVFLPDQTVVTLNAGSRILYPVHFNGDERAVELYGEALFNVASDPDRPFTVKTGDLKIKVLGTVFNIKDYKDDLSSSVSVACGKVEVILPAVETGYAQSLILEHDQHINRNKTTGMISKLSIDAGKYMSWPNGTFFFHRTPIHEVVNMLNRHYPQVNIELAKGEYTDILITGEYNNTYHLEKIIRRIIYTTDLKCKKTGNKYTLYH